MKRSTGCRNRGSVVSLAFVACVPLVGAIGGFSVDCMHVNDATGQLKRACDAAALAGAEDIPRWNGTGSVTGTTVDTKNNAEPVNFAIKIAGMNGVDGPNGLQTSSTLNRSVSATLSKDPKYGGPSGSYNRCDVTGTVYINSLFAKFFGNFGQTISTKSAAAFAGPQVTTVTDYLPILVSLTDLDPSNRQLQKLSSGSTYTIEIKTDSVWIQNPSVDDKAIVDYLANPSGTPPTLPSISVGDTIQSDNGIKSAGQDFNLLQGKTIVFPVTTDNVGTGTPSHKVTGFMAITISGYSTKNPYQLTGTISPASTVGTSTGGGTVSVPGDTIQAARLIL